MYLAVHAIATCRPKPLLELNNPSQPYLLDFGAVMFDRQGAIVEQLSTFVKPGPTAKLTTGAYKNHGISLDLARRIGQEPDDVFDWFRKHALEVDCIVGHDVHLLSQVMRIAGARATGDIWFPPCEMYCTMSLEKTLLPMAFAERNFSTDPIAERPPTLPETYERITGTAFTGSRSAINYAKACMAIHRQIQRADVSG
ncbi:MAG: hypothetical protein ACK4Z8_01840 [Novosphingobium sp.]